MRVYSESTTIGRQRRTKGATFEHHKMLAVKVGRPVGAVGHTFSQCFHLKHPEYTKAMAASAAFPVCVPL